MSTVPRSPYSKASVGAKRGGHVALSWSARNSIMDLKAIDFWLVRSKNTGKKAALGFPFLRLVFVACGIGMLSMTVSAQTPSPSPQSSPASNPQAPVEASRKANERPIDSTVTAPEPFDGASVDKMAEQCVTLETDLGSIEIEMMPEVAPESVRNFLNLSATGALDTTTFSRVIKGFIIQGGNLATSGKWGVELSKRASRKLPDEPGIVKHVRGIVSMARADEPNSASTHFFILVGDGPHLNSKFAAFGRVRKGIEVADAINSAQTDGDKPVKAVRINRVVVTQCVK